jgi:septal ring factor EnvC (AmiA/AmiB activator)
VKKTKLLVSFLLFNLLLINQGQAGLFDKISGSNESQTDVDKTKQDIEQKKADLQKRLAEVEKRYGEVAAALKVLQTQIEQAQKNLGKNQQDRQAYQKEIDKHSKELSAQVKVAYAMGRKEKLKILLNQQDPVLFSRMMLYYNYINSARLKRLNDINAAIKYQGQLDQQKETDTRLLEKSLEQQQVEQVALDDVKKQRKELLKQLMRDFSSRQQQLSDLKESENKLRGLISSLQNDKNTPDNTNAIPTEDSTKPVFDQSQANKDFAALQGQLPLPVNGSIRKFGIARAKGVWDGVLISASEGTEVRAVASGKVAYADLLQGYGSLIIIDHGQGYMTVHGFNQSLYKHIGDSVTAGDVIASVGKSGGRKQSGLYFGIRKQGMPVDPLSWFVKQSK